MAVTEANPNAEIFAANNTWDWFRPGIGFIWIAGCGLGVREFRTSERGGLFPHRFASRRAANPLPDGASRTVWQSTLSKHQPVGLAYRKEFSHEGESEC